MATVRRSGFTRICIALGVPTMILIGWLATGDHLQYALAQSNKPDTSARQKQVTINTDCMNLVRAVFDRATKMPSSDSVLKFSSVIDAQYADSTTVQNGVSQVNFTLHQDQVEVSCKHFIMCRDSNLVFAVIPAAHAIYLGEAVRPESPDWAEMSIQWMRDSLLRRSTVVECSNVVDSTGGMLLQVELVPDGAAQGYFNVASMILVIDTLRKELRASTVVPLRPELYKQITWTFSEYRVEPAPVKFHRPVASQFLSDGKKLLPEWKEYELVDNRIGATN